MPWNDVQADSITWPAGSVSGADRMVAGADTPAELQAYGISVAAIFYVTGVEESGLETGYFFIGLSNTIDIGNDEACLFGSVRYPTAGDPSSATSADVKTFFQMSWDFSGTGATGKAYTVFKDWPIFISDTVPYTIISKDLQVNGTLTISSGALGIYTPTAPSLQNSWVDYGGAYETAKYWKDALGKVHLQGMIKNGTTTVGTLLFTLPAGYRPPATLTCIALSANVLQRIDILANGDVKIATTASGSWISFNAISFGTV